MALAWSLAGYALAMAFLAATMGVATQPFGLLHPPALLLVVAGTAALALVHHRPRELQTLNEPLPATDPDAVHRRLVALAVRGRTDGLRGLERELAHCGGELESQGLALIVSCATAAEVDSALRATAAREREADLAPARVWQTLSRGAVNAGILVSLSGIVMALAAVPPSLTSGALAGALTATVYGLVLGQFICAPQASRRLRAARAADELRTTWINGLLAVQSGVNPRLLAERLRQGERPDRVELAA